ncbi:T9SS type A sorting domain-containing protein [Aureivirga marina]|uniref:T9SS type A sorting domain-containing protein n=1 Tax=Aureivirga marina TaxID=1182451 RepID=UPI0018CA2060|nr:T9SS type A sorting domain-containing protein [Aureivirga marina]
MRRTLLFLFLIFGLTTVNSQNCSDPNYTFTSQAQLDAFTEDCTTITGRLVLDGSNITDLSILSKITTVGEYIELYDNDLITNTNGLENLTSVNGVLIDDNDMLTSLSGFSGLTAIGGKLQINDNANLQNVSGFDNVQSVSGDIDVFNNPNLISFEAFSNVTTIGEDLYIEDNIAIPSLAGFENITTITGDLLIQDNTLLTSCTAICELLDGNGIGGNIFISGNATGCESQGAIETECDNCPGFPIDNGNYRFTSQAELDAFTTNCTKITGNLIIGASNLEESDITDLSILTKITEIEGGVEIFNNDLLITTSGLENVTTISQGIYIDDNELLTSLTGFSGLNSIDDKLLISDNASLENITGFENITSIADKLEILDNASLISLDALSSVTTVGDDVKINGNIILETLEGLSSITSIGGNLEVQNNFFLETCTAFCALFENNGVSGAILISNNEEDCDSKEAIEEKCAECPGFPNNDGNYLFTSQAELDNFTTNCSKITGYLKIQESDISDLSILSKIISVGDYLELDSNHSLTGTSGLENIIYVGTNVIIDNNNTLTSLTGFSGLNSVEGDLYFGGNDALESILGFENLTEINGNLRFFTNSNLTDVTALSNITSIGGHLSIQENMNLETLEGLNNITTVTGDLFMQDNAVLATCTALCDLLENDGVGGVITISNNDDGCESKQDILDNCSLDITENSLENFTYYPNPVRDVLTVPNGIKEIELYNYTGQFLEKFKVKNNQVSLVEYDNGFYIIKLINDKNQKVSKTLLISK